MRERVPLFGEITGDRRPLAVASVVLSPLKIRLRHPIEERQVLVVRREAEDLWEPPVDLLRSNESLAACAKRVVLEQVGIKVRESFPTVMYENTAHPARPITIGWRCEADPEQSPSPSHEIADVEWIPVSEISSRVSPLTDTCINDAQTFHGDIFLHREHDGHEITQW